MSGCFGRRHSRESADEPSAKRARTATATASENATEKRFGEWKSPIEASLIASSTITLQETAVLDGTVFWLEMRPADNGRYVVVRENADGTTTDMIPTPYSARSIVYSYGGGPWAVGKTSNVVYFANYDPKASDYRVYTATDGKTASPLTSTPDCRYGNLVYDRVHNQVFAIREDWRGIAEPMLPAVSIVSINCETGEEKVEIQGADLYFVGEVNEDGSLLSYVAWNYPNMPWDGTSVYVAFLADDGSVSQTQYISGGSTTSSLEPRFGPDGNLYYLSDSSGSWNFVRVEISDDGNEITLSELTHEKAEFGAPPWGCESRMYAFDAGQNRIVAALNTQGVFSMVTVSLSDGSVEPVKKLSEYTSIAHVVAGDGVLAFVGANWTTPAAVLKLDIAKGEKKVLRVSSTIDEKIAPYIATPEIIQFKTTDGATAHGFYYPPTNPDFKGPSNEKPPLILKSHGGPSAAASTGLDLKTNYFTSRGIAVVDVNYRGSSGYGRDYLRSLYGWWGVYDPQDCEAAGKFLVDRGDADGDRLVAEGGSAGGYCTNVLATYGYKLAAGASYYGISNLLQLAAMTGNYERHYIDQLVGPLPASTDLYEERSPFYHLQDPKVKTETPVIFFQGEDDPVVPPDQTKELVKSLDARKVPVSLMLFPDEQHGFRKAEDIEKSLQGEEYFLGVILGYTPAETLPKVPIDNWPRQ